MEARRTMKRTMRRALGVTAAALLLLAATAASADSDGGILVQKMGGGMLLLEEGVRVHVADGARITNAAGEAITYAQIPTPEESAPAPVRIEWTGAATGAMVEADTVEIERVLN